MTLQENRSSLWTLPIIRAFAPPSSDATPAAETGRPTELPPWAAPGSQLRVNARAAARSYYAPSVVGAPTTTRQAEILNTAVIGPPTGTKGVVIGRDALSRTAIAHDPITAYNLHPREVSSPNSIVAGDVGGGKSSFVKTTNVIRPLILQRRRAVVFDKKDQNGEGEYSETTRCYGHDPLRFTTDGTGTRLNLLDPMIAAGTGTQGQARLLNIVTRLARGDRALDEWEGEALRAALRLTLEQIGGRNPVLADVLPNLGRVLALAEYSELSPDARDKLHQAGLAVRWTLTGLLDEYGSLLDGETSRSVDLTGKLTSFDISQLPDDGPAVPVVMAIGHNWLLGRLRGDRGYATNIVWEEGWHMIDGPIALLVKSAQKLARGLGIANTFVIHKGTDIPADSPGITIIQEAQSVYIFRQSRPEDAAWSARTFAFAPETADAITKLRDGNYIFKYGAHPETQVRHIRSDWEIALTNTDEAMAAAVGER